MTRIADIRTEYTRGALELAEVLPDPVAQFETWFQQALHAKVLEPNAMALATAVEGQPSCRIVLLKGIEDGGFVFFTNYESHKGSQLAGNPQVALTFFWAELERQVRIEGRAARIPPEASAAYYRSRDRGSRIGAWASPQSRAIPDRAALEARVAETAARFEGLEDIPCPPHWGGYCVKPHFIEFWQGRPSRLHDRIAYALQPDGSWNRERLAP